MTYKFVVTDDEHKIERKEFDKFCDAYDYAQHGLVTIIEAIPCENGECFYDDSEVVWTWDDTWDKETICAKVNKEYPNACCGNCIEEEIDDNKISKKDLKKFDIFTDDIITGERKELQANNKKSEVKEISQDEFEKIKKDAKPFNVFKDRVINERFYDHKGEGNFGFNHNTLEQFIEEYYPDLASKYEDIRINDDFDDAGVSIEYGIDEGNLYVEKVLGFSFDERSIKFAGNTEERFDWLNKIFEEATNKNYNGLNKELTDDYWDMAGYFEESLKNKKLKESILLLIPEEKDMPYEEFPEFCDGEYKTCDLEKVEPCCQMFNEIPDCEIGEKGCCGNPFDCEWDRCDIVADEAPAASIPVDEKGFEKPAEEISKCHVCPECGKEICECSKSKKANKILKEYFYDEKKLEKELKELGVVDWQLPHREGEDGFAIICTYVLVNAIKKNNPEFFKNNFAEVPADRRIDEVFEYEYIGQNENYKKLFNSVHKPLYDDGNYFHLFIGDCEADYSEEESDYNWQTVWAVTTYLKYTGIGYDTDDDINKDLDELFKIFNPEDSAIDSALSALADEQWDWDYLDRSDEYDEDDYYESLNKKRLKEALSVEDVENGCEELKGLKPSVIKLLLQVYQHDMDIKPNKITIEDFCDWVRANDSLGGLAIDYAEELNKIAIWELGKDDPRFKETIKQAGIEANLIDDNWVDRAQRAMHWAHIDEITDKTKNYVPVKASFREVFDDLFELTSEEKLFKNLREIYKKVCKNWLKESVDPRPNHTKLLNLDLDEEALKEMILQFLSADEKEELVNMYDLETIDELDILSADDLLQYLSDDDVAELMRVNGLDDWDDEEFLEEFGKAMKEKHNKKKDLISKNKLKEHIIIDKLHRKKLLEKHTITEDNDSLEPEKIKINRLNLNNIFKKYYVKCENLDIVESYDLFEKADNRVKDLSRKNNSGLAYILVAKTDLKEPFNTQNNFIDKLFKNNSNACVIKKYESKNLKVNNSEIIIKFAKEALIQKKDYDKAQELVPNANAVDLKVEKLVDKEYIVGETLNTADFKVIYGLDDVTDKCKFSPEKLEQAGEQKITIICSYGQKQLKAETTVTVKEPENKETENTNSEETEPTEDASSTYTIAVLDGAVFKYLEGQPKDMSLEAAKAAAKAMSLLKVYAGKAFRVCKVEQSGKVITRPGIISYVDGREKAFKPRKVK